MASSKQVVGNPTPRVEGELKVSGEAKYAVDITVPGMLWGKLLRSPIASGKIKSINTSQAEALPGVHAVVTGQDCAGLKIGRRLYDMPILADGEVRFIGEKVAAVAADDELIAEEALTLIEVEYEETEPLLDPVEALKPGAKLLHPDVTSYKGLPKPLKEPTNDFVYVTWGKGDLETGFRQADVIVENTFTTPVVHQSYIEPHSCVVSTAADGSAEFWSCSKVPYGVREQVANALKLPQEKLNFNPVYIGGDFGGKGDFMDLAVVYLLSKKAGRPVKLVMDYEEEFTAGNPRHASIIQVKTGVKKDGTLVAHHMNFIFDSGAYGAFKPNAFLNGPHLSAGPYKIPHVFLEEHMVYTNKIPCGHMRSPGDPQGFFANESQLDLIAKKLSMDPIKLRQKNFMHDGDIDPTGEEYSYIKTDETLKKALDDSGYQKPKPKNVGRGVALGAMDACRGHRNGGDLAGRERRCDDFLRDGRSRRGHLYGPQRNRRGRAQDPTQSDQDSATGYADRYQRYRRGRQPGNAGLWQRRLYGSAEGGRGDQASGGRANGNGAGSNYTRKRSGATSAHGTTLDLWRNRQSQGSTDRRRCDF